MPRAGGEYCVLRLIRQVYRKRSVPEQVEPVRQILTVDALVRRRGYAKPVSPCPPPLSAAIPTGFASFCPGFGGRLVHVRGMPARAGNAVRPRDGSRADDAVLRNGSCRRSRRFGPAPGLPVKTGAPSFAHDTP